jgi:enediyne biosynthesis protein E3
MHGFVARQDFEHQQSQLRRLLTHLLSIDPAEASFQTRGFPSSHAQPLLEAAGEAFLAGYNLVLSDPDPRRLMRHISQCSQEQRGFVAEGAAMGAAVQTALMPWRDKLAPIMTALSTSYIHLAHVGVGWAIARLPFARRRLANRLDGRLVALAVDGRGFHDAYFYGNEAAGRRRPKGEWGCIYDQGVGRALWFSSGANPEILAAKLAAETTHRQHDYWAGIGLACVYAGGADNSEIEHLSALAANSRSWFRQGAAFAVAAHARAGVVPDQALSAAQCICDRKADELVDIVDVAFNGSNESQPQAYQDWRRQVAAKLRGASK